MDKKSAECKNEMTFKQGIKMMQKASRHGHGVTFQSMCEVVTASKDMRRSILNKSFECGCWRCLKYIDDNSVVELTEEQLDAKNRELARDHIELMRKYRAGGVCGDCDCATCRTFAESGEIK